MTAGRTNHTQFATAQEGRALRGGCLRRTHEDGTQTVCWPGDLLFSTYTMIAQEYYDERRGWLPTAIAD